MPDLNLALSEGLRLGISKVFAGFSRIWAMASLRQGECRSAGLQVNSEITSLQTKLGRVTASSEAEWSKLSHIIQQDRHARVLRLLPRHFLFQPTTTKSSHQHT